MAEDIPIKKNQDVVCLIPGQYSPNDIHDNFCDAIGAATEWARDNTAGGVPEDFAFSPKDCTIKIVLLDSISPPHPISTVDVKRNPKKTDNYPDDHRFGTNNIVWNCEETDDPEQDQKDRENMVNTIVDKLLDKCKDKKVLEDAKRRQGILNTNNNPQFWVQQTIVCSVGFGKDKIEGGSSGTTEVTPYLPKEENNIHKNR